MRGWLAPQLQNAGLSVCIDHKSFEPGVPLVTEIERAVEQSRKTILVLTPAYLESEWTEVENILVQTRDPAARQRRLIPLRLQPCELPLRLISLTSLDFTYPENQEALLSRLAISTPAFEHSLMSIPQKC